MEPVVIISMVAAFLVYSNTLTADFAYDDGRAIQTNPDVKPGSSVWNLLGHDFWGTPLTHSGSHKSYRPVTVLTFRLNYWLGSAWETSPFVTGGPTSSIFGAPWSDNTEAEEEGDGRVDPDSSGSRNQEQQPPKNPCVYNQYYHRQHQGLPSAATFHLVNVILHAIATGLYSTLCCRLLRSSSSSSSPNSLASFMRGIGRREAASVASLAFAVHPVHTEAVAGIVGRADVCACIFFLLSFQSYLDYIAARATANRSCRRVHMVRRVSNGGDGHQINNNRRRHRHQSCDSCSSQPGTASSSLLTSSQSSSALCASSHQLMDSSIHEVTRDIKLDGRRRGSPSASPPPRTKCSPTYPRWRLALCVIFAILSMLSKEHGLTVLGVCAVYDLFVVTKLKPKDIFDAIFTRRKLPGPLLEGVVILAVTTVLCVALRVYVMGAKPPEFSPADNPAADSSSFLTRSLTFLYLPAVNFWLLLCPSVLSFDWSMDAIPLLTSFWDVRNVQSIAFYSCFIWACRYAFLHYMRSDRKSGDTSIYSASVGWTKSSKSQQQAKETQSKASTAVMSFVGGECELELSTAGSNGIGPHRRHPAQRHSASVSPPRCARLEEHDLDEGDKPLFEDGDILLLSLALMSIPFLPATNLFFYVGFVVAERVLYIPSMGYCLLLGLGAHKVTQLLAAAPSLLTPSTSPVCRRRRTSKSSEDGNRRGFYVTLVCGILLVIFSLRTYRRNEDWSTEEKLYRAGIPVNPPKAYGNVANILSAKGMKEEAELAYKMALSYRSNMADVHYNMGILYQEQKRYQEALQSYTRAIQFRPRMAMAHLNMGLVLGILGRREEAMEVYRKCAQLDVTGLKDPRTHEATKTSALFNLGRLLADDDRVDDAIQSYMEAVQKMPSHYQPQSLYNMLGEAYFKLGDWTEAEKWYLNALKAKPDHVPAHLTYGKLLAKSSRLQEAEDLFKKAKLLSPEDSTVYQHFGQFLAESERHEEAAENYVKAASIASNDYEIVFNAANTLRQAGRNKEAEKFYRKAVLIRPEEATSHMNLGAMLHVNGKLDEAEASYLEALRLKPDDKITQANLQKLRQLLHKVNARTSSNSRR